MVNHNNFFMSVEADPEIQGVLIKNQSVILEPNRQQELEQKGYGDMVNDKLVLKPFESLYLLYTGKLALFKEKKNVGFDLWFAFYVLLSSVWLPVAFSIAFTVHSLQTFFSHILTVILKTLYGKK